MKLHSSAVKEDLHKRLRRVEGQVRGVQKMLEEERDCREIVQQLKAAQAALRNATDELMRAYAKDCLLQDPAPDAVARAALVDDLLDLMARAQ